MQGQRIAIVGGGIAGMGCAWFLHRKFDVTLFENEDRIGGHSHTITVDDGDGEEARLDTGFMVYNEVTYPQLTRLFQAIEVPTKPTSMSFSVQHGPSGIEWNGAGLNTLFAQRRNLFNLRHWRFLSQLNRFNREAVAALDEPEWQSMTLAEYVDRRGYGQDFLERYLVPMSSAVWSTPPEKMLHFPAVTLLRFWHNHGFLGLDTQHPWRTVVGGSREYVERLTAPFQDRIRLSSTVSKISRDKYGVSIETTANGSEAFDQVILATHAPTSLAMLDQPTDLEQEILAPFAYQANEVRVHRNRTVMPETKRCWASWNYRTDNEGKPTVHYWMNSLQGVSERNDYFVSLNSEDLIGDDDLVRELDYEHPLFDLDAIAAQNRIPELNRTDNDRRTYYAGAWTRYGFHEDGLLSAVKVSEQLLGGDPWQLR
jgi:predicted NAD/FAD-binding protein